MTYPKQPSIAIDSVVFDPQGRLLLIRRKNFPFQGRYALPGGFMECGGTAEQGGARELLEETGLRATSQILIGVYSSPDRDPRDHVISIPFLTVVSSFEPCAADDALTAEFIENWMNLPLAFDHDVIVQDAMKIRATQ